MNLETMTLTDLRMLVERQDKVIAGLEEEVNALESAIEKIVDNFWRLLKMYNSDRGRAARDATG